MWEDGERETGRREEWSEVVLGKYCEERSERADTLYLQQVKREKYRNDERERTRERKRDGRKKGEKKDRDREKPALLQHRHKTASEMMKRLKAR